MTPSTFSLGCLTILAALSQPPALASDACVAEMAGYPRAHCELAAAFAEDLCDAPPAALRRTLDRRIKRARRLLRKAERTTRAKRSRKLLDRVDRGLAKIPAKTDRLTRRSRISEECNQTVASHIAAIRSLVAELRSDVPTAPAGLPEFVAGYQDWLRLNAEPILPRQGGDAHFGTKNVFVNRTRETLAPNGAQRFPYPGGTIIVKESRRPSADYVGLVAIMRKVAGSDPAHGDWTFIEYSRGSATAAFSPLARDTACFGCHRAAESTDWVYTPLD